MVDIGATTIGSSLIGTANITPIDHLIVWCIGASTLIWGAILKKIPVELFEKVSDHISLEDENNTNDPLNKMFAHASEVHNKARRSIGIAHTDPQANLSTSQVPRSFADDSKEPEEDSQTHNEDSDSQAVVHPVPDHGSDNSS